MGFTFYELYDYKITDPRFKKGYSIINKIEVNGKANFNLWMRKIGFYSPKHQLKIKKVAGSGFEFGSSIFESASTDLRVMSPPGTPD